jgi:HIV Tat-specific factor 1
VPTAIKAPQSRRRKPKKQNSAVYVTSVPLDVTVAGIHEVFSKFGLIAQEINRDRPRVILYKDKEGNVKGDTR